MELNARYLHMIEESGDKGCVCFPNNENISALLESLLAFFYRQTPVPKPNCYL
jgi:hypothetical protein